MFAGALQQVPLGEVLRLLSMSSQTGALILEAPGFSGSIFFQVGQIVHASTGELEGLDALTLICERVEANYAFSEGFIAPARSLADYPSDRLIEKVRKRAEEILALRKAVLGPRDIPCYMPGRKVAGLVAKPDELSLLLLADGKRAVYELAKLGQRDVREVGEILGKFRHAGVLDVVGEAPAEVVAAANPAPPEPSVPEVREPTPPPSPEPVSVELEPKPVRYWRGKRID